MIEYITANWDSIVTIVLALIGLAAIVARYTPTPKDDTLFAFLYDLVSSVTPNDRKLLVEQNLEKVEEVVDKVEEAVDSVNKKE